ncbi:hypothetical protein F2P81_021300 [Scophthalmus maximus]|uniref:Ras-related protein Rab-20-like n=1 Tax=Scophthalmus maximus TaxID=52904 RepID=A0A6A4RWT2_SCOMX|nr:hypothetical protein F2P81_021300 [Scophthalmus maximus]
MPEASKMKKPDVKVVLLGDMNVGKTSLLHSITDTVDPLSVSSGREQFHGLGSMYCRGASAVILTYDVTNWQSLAELEERFLSLTDTAHHGCIYAVVGNKADLTDSKAQLSQDSDGVSEDQIQEEMTKPQVLSACPTPPASPASLSGMSLNKQVTREDAMAFYGRILRYKGLEEKGSLPAEKMCFETSAKTGYNVDTLFETLFDLVLPSILRNRNENLQSPTVDLEECRGAGSKRARSTCC